MTKFLSIFFLCNFYFVCNASEGSNRFKINAYILGQRILGLREGNNWKELFQLVMLPDDQLQKLCPNADVLEEGVIGCEELSDAALSSELEQELLRGIEDFRTEFSSEENVPVEHQELPITVASIEEEKIEKISVEKLPRRFHKRAGKRVQERRMREREKCVLQNGIVVKIDGRAQKFPARSNIVHLVRDIRAKNPNCKVVLTMVDSQGQKHSTSMTNYRTQLEQILNDQKCYFRADLAFPENK